MTLPAFAADWLAARQALAAAYIEAHTAGETDCDRVAEAMLARLAYLDPPLVVLRSAVEEERDRLRSQVEVADIAADAAAEAVGATAERLSAVLAENTRLQAEADGWRSENDRHRSLYVEAVKELDRSRRTVRVLFQFARKRRADANEAVAERDRLRDVVDAARAWRRAQDDPDRDDAYDEMDDLYEALDALEATDG